MFYTEEFINHLKMNHYSYSTLKAYKKDLGDFEAYLACNDIKDAMNIVYISKLLGHSSIETTRGYLHVDLKQLKQEINAKHPRMRMEKYIKNKE